MTNDDYVRRNDLETRICELHNLTRLVDLAFQGCSFRHKGGTATCDSEAAEVLEIAIDKVVVAAAELRKLELPRTTPRAA